MKFHLEADVTSKELLSWAVRGNQHLQIVQVMKCQEPWWITLMIKHVFWVTGVKSGRGRTECNMATTCPCQHQCSKVKAMRVNTPDNMLPCWGNTKSPCEPSQTGLFSHAQVTADRYRQHQSNAFRTVLFFKRSNRVSFSLTTSLLPCCFIHRAQGSFAKSSVVDLRRQTVLQIHQNSVRLNDILLWRLVNRKENSGGSALKPPVFRQISCSASQRDPLKYLLSSRGALEEMLLSFAHIYTQMHAFTRKHTPYELGNGRKNINQHSVHYQLHGTDGDDASVFMSQQQD